MGVWVTGVRDAWEDFDVVVNNGIAVKLLNFFITACRENKE